MALLIAGCSNGVVKLDSTATREMQRCPKPPAAMPPPGEYADQGIALDYSRLAPLPEPTEGANLPLNFPIIDRFKDGIATSIETMSRTEHGLWMVDGPPITLSQDSSPLEIGEATLAALAKSRAVPHPESWAGLDDDPMLREAGVKSWRTFSRTAAVLEVKLDAEFVMTPTRNDGPREGFTHLNEKNERLPASATAEVLGDAVVRALARCE